MTARSIIPVESEGTGAAGGVPPPNTPGGSPICGGEGRAPFHHPPEWHPHAATWLAWPPNGRDWGPKHDAVLWVFAEIVRHLLDSEPVRLVVANEQVEQQARTRLTDSGLPVDRVDFVRFRTTRCWLRDMGPIFGRDATGERVVLHFLFTAWGKYRRYRDDAELPAWVAQRLGIPRVCPEHKGRRVVLEGGAFDVDGAGHLIATEQCLLDQTAQPRNPGWTRDDYRQVFETWLGAREIIWLGRGIAGDDDTHGHVDDVCRFTGPGQVVLAEEDDPRDANYAALRENRERLESVRLENGGRLEIVPLPMPGPRHFRGRRLPASYANFYIGNTVVLVPTFNDPADREALGRLAELFPGRRVVGVYCGDLVVGLGALHCLMHEEPAAARRGVNASAVD